MKNQVSLSLASNNRSLVNCRGRLIDLSQPAVMGILNLTPDSFFDGGKFTDMKQIIRRVKQMRDEGALIIDIGANSSRPGAKMVAESTELKRLLPVVKAILDKFPEIILSIDTFRAGVASRCLDEGAAIINDISAGALDNDMFDTVVRHQVPYVLMHMKGTPDTMNTKPAYRDVVSEVYEFLGSRLIKLRRMGLHDVIVDPGFGFAKNLEHNYRILKSLETFSTLGCPVLAGLSRKSMVCKVLGLPPAKALNGTTALHMLALSNGASLLRVHDIKEAVEAIKLYNQYQDS